MNLIFSMNIPTNSEPDSEEPPATTKIVKNVLLKSPVAAHIEKLSLHKNIKSQSGFYKNTTSYTEHKTNNYYSNFSSILSINNLYTKNCKNCGK